MRKRDLIRSAKKLSDAKKDWGLRFQQYFATVKSLRDTEFWPLLAEFRLQVFRFKFDYERQIEDAALEFFRKPYAREGNYSIDEAVSFAKTYQEKARAIYHPLMDIIKDRGDDSYGDLLDVLPLMGQEMYERCLKSDFQDNEDFTITIQDMIANASAVKDKKKFNDFILHGEN